MVQYSSMVMILIRVFTVCLDRFLGENISKKGKKIKLCNQIKGVFLPNLQWARDQIKLINQIGIIGIRYLI